MNGWISLAMLVTLSLAAARILGLRGLMLQLGGAALLFGAAGYAIQGHPSLDGSSGKAVTSTQVIPLTGARHAFFGEFSAAESWMRMSEGLAGRGNTSDAVGILVNAANRHPNDPQLWVGLGNALVDHARVLTPPAVLAFERAKSLAPQHPAAPFFYGLALARSGDRDGALRQWRQLLAGAPAEASWRPLVEDAVAALDRGR